jgi:hypothetical protein
MAHICNKYNLLDILDHQHSDEAHVPSYAYSNNRLDYAIVSRDLVDYITTSGLNHYHTFYPSDHRPLFVGFDDTLFGSHPAITSARTRYVNSNTTNVNICISHVYKHLQDTGTFKRLHKYQEKLPTLMDKASIDGQITRALLSAELKCKKPIKAPWLDILHYASLQVKYWRLTFAAKTNYYDCVTTLANINAELPVEKRQSPQPTLTPTQSLNLAKKALTAAILEAEQLRKTFLEERRERITTRKETVRPILL